MSEPLSPSTPAPAAYPVVFGEDRHQLFGWFHPPAVLAGQTRDCLVVMCNPIGYDAICTHRHYRVLARQLADAGFAVLRYDHHGTGDSAGTDEDPERFPSWIKDVSTAVAFGKQTSGASHVSLFGVRMGATLALAAAMDTPLADSLVVWAAFPSGSLYLREMRALRQLRDADASAPPVAHDAGADLGEEAAGYLFTASTVAELGGLNLLTGTVPPAPQVLLLARDDVPVNDKLARHLLKIGCAVDQPVVPGYAAMMFDTFDAIVPVEAFAEIAVWLDRQHPLRAAQAMSAVYTVPRLIAGSRGAESDVVESPVSFGPEGRFFGIFSESQRPQGLRAQTGIVLVNVGSNHHIGPNRMYVTQARMFASLGFVALRMDIGGVGESPASPGRQDNHLYAQHSIGDVLEAIRFLREQRQVKQVVLIGVCSGAYLSFHTAIADPSVASIVLINPQTFTWREGDSLKLKMSQDIRPLNFYRREIFNPQTWKRLFKGQINAGLIITGISGILKRRLALRLADSLDLDSASKDPAKLNVRGSFRKLLKQGMNVFLLYSAHDGGLPEMGTQLGRHAASLRKFERFRFECVDGADHTFTPIWAQRRLLDLLTQHLMRLHG